MNKLGYSYILNENNDNRLYSLNESISEMMTEDTILKQFESIEFEIEGSVEDKNLRMMVSYTTKDGKIGKKEYSSHVDDGAIELNEYLIKTYFGEERLKNIKKDLDAHFGILEADYLKNNEPDFFQQLSEEYLLQSSPDINNGCEFTDSDKNFFNDILKGCK